MGRKRRGADTKFTYEQFYDPNFAVSGGIADPPQLRDYLEITEPAKRAELMGITITEHEEGNATRYTIAGGVLETWAKTDNDDYTNYVRDQQRFGKEPLSFEQYKEAEATFTSWEELAEYIAMLWDIATEPVRFWYFNKEDREIHEMLYHFEKLY